MLLSGAQYAMPNKVVRSTLNKNKEVRNAQGGGPFHKCMSLNSIVYFVSEVRKYRAHTQTPHLKAFCLIILTHMACPFSSAFRHHRSNSTCVITCDVRITFQLPVSRSYAVLLRLTESCCNKRIIYSTTHSSLQSIMLCMFLSYLNFITWFHSTFTDSSRNLN